MMRHAVSKKPILNDPVCVDDFGNIVFICQYTRSFVATDLAIFIGPCMPNVTGTYACAPDAMPAYKRSRTAFNEAEANCNTCRHLRRVPHEKNKAGHLFGECIRGMSDQVMQFHPDDPMGMSCWESR
jgi:hypothetical protein